MALGRFDPGSQFVVAQLLVELVIGGTLRIRQVHESNMRVLGGDAGQVLGAYAITDGDELEEGVAGSASQYSFELTVVIGVAVGDDANVGANWALACFRTGFNWSCNFFFLAEDAGEETFLLWSWRRNGSDWSSSWNYALGLELDDDWCVRGTAAS
ncbi:hypothetical protein D3C75_772950 [compost metagenome]